MFLQDTIFYLVEYKASDESRGGDETGHASQFSAYHRNFSCIGNDILVTSVIHISSLCNAYLVGYCVRFPIQLKSLEIDYIGYLDCLRMITSFHIVASFS